VVWYQRRSGDWSGYFRESPYRTNLLRISANYIDGEDVPLATRAGMYIQHYAAPPHISRVVIHYLNNTSLVDGSTAVVWLNATKVSTLHPFRLWFVGVDVEPGIPKKGEYTRRIACSYFGCFKVV
jgi:hypothetical protein